jgi:hypothetical protein
LQRPRGSAIAVQSRCEKQLAIGAACRRRTTKLLEFHMNITLSIGPLVSLIAGILILAAPRLLNYIVALYLIIIGVLGLFGAGNFHFK